MKCTRLCFHEHTINFELRDDFTRLMLYYTDREVITKKGMRSSCAAEIEEDSEAENDLGHISLLALMSKFVKPLRLTI